MSGKYPTAPPPEPAGYQPQPGVSGYSIPPQSYPQAPYPPSSYPYQLAAQQSSAPYGAPGAPPPYSAAQQAVPQGAPPPYSQYPYQQAPLQPLYPQQPQTVYAQGAFDSGARFDGVAQPRIPPPPPGVTPNTAQMAAMQGHNVVGTQQKAGWFSGGKGGGFTWW